MTSDAIKEAIQKEFCFWFRIFVLGGTVLGGLVTYIYIDFKSDIKMAVERNQTEVNKLSNRVIGVERDVQHLMNKVYFKGE